MAQLVLRYLRRSTILAALGAGCVGQNAAAKPVDPFSLSPEQLFDATVTSASRAPENLRDVSAAIYVITGEDIARSGATTIAEALRLAPGVNVAQASSTSWAVSVRGFNDALANKLLVLMDGREVYDPLFSGVYWDVQDTLIEDIDRIEIIRGPGASLWGANAVNGVINIITKSADDTQGALASLVAGDKERSAGVRYGGALGAGGRWRGYAKYTDREPQRQLAAPGQDWESTRGGFRYDWSGGGQALTFQGDLYQSKSVQLRQKSSLAPPYAVLSADPIDAYGGNLLGRWSSAFSNGSRFVAQALVDGTARAQATIDERRFTYDIDTQYELPDLGPHKIMVGLGYRHTRDRFGDTAVVFAPGDGVEEERLSGFVQDRITLPRDWAIIIGSKFEHNDFTGVEVQPNLRVQSGGDRHSVWASVSRAIRSPSELERDLKVAIGVLPPMPAIPVPTKIELAPSPQFESEELVAYEFGYRRDWGGGVETDIALFRNEYHGLATLSLAPISIATNPLHVILPIVTTNSSVADSAGIEAVAAWRPTAKANLSLAYTFFDLNVTGPPPSVAISSEAAETRTPRHQVTLRGQWEMTPSLSADTTLYYVDAVSGFHLAPNLRADARIGWRLNDAIQLDFVGQNLFDRSHREFYEMADVNATNIERSAYVRLTWRK